MKTGGLGRGLSALLNNDVEKVPLKNEEKKVEKVKKIKVHTEPVKKESIFAEATADRSSTSVKTKTDKKTMKEDEFAESFVEYKYIDVNKIDTNPYQPRKEFDETGIDELAQAISRSGFITPILVNNHGKSGNFTLVAGERRLRACKKLGLAEIPAIVKDLTDSQMMQIAIIENVQRKNLNPIEEAKAFQNMRDMLNLTPEEIANSVGLPHYYIVQKLKLTKLPEILQRYVAGGELSEGAGVALLKLDSDDAMIAAAKIAIRQHMSRTSVERLVEKILLSKGIEPKDPNFHLRNKYQYFLDAFKDTLGWNMKIKGGINGKGRIEIEFLDDIDLKDIYKKLEKVLK